MSRTHRYALAVLATAGMLLAAPGTAVAAPDVAKSDPAGAVAAPAEATAKQAVWTEERKRNARPAAEDATPARAARAVPDGPAESGTGWLPRTGKAAGFTGPITALAGGTAEEWTTHGSAPARTIGRLYYTNDQGSDGYCTASVINSANRKTIWTAGHCVHGGGSGRGWFTNFRFEADYDNGSYFDVWFGSVPITVNGWINDRNFDYDIGAVVLAPNARGLIADVTGFQGYSFNNGYTWSVHSFGYPQDGVPDRPIFTGTDLLYCTGGVSQTGSRMQLLCDMHHGASGGPWISDLQTSRGWGYIIGAYSGRNANLNTPEAWSSYHGTAAINIRNHSANF